MMAKDPENRPTADDIMSMDIFSEKNKVRGVSRWGKIREQGWKVHWCAEFPLLRTDLCSDQLKGDKFLCISVLC